MDEFITPVQEAIGALHEMFESLMAGGFTEDQGLTIVAKILTQQRED